MAGQVASVDITRVRTTRSRDTFSDAACCSGSTTTRTSADSSPIARAPRIATTDQSRRSGRAVQPVCVSAVVEASWLRLRFESCAACGRADRDVADGDAA